MSDATKILFGEGIPPYAQTGIRELFAHNGGDVGQALQQINDKFDKTLEAKPLEDGTIYVHTAEPTQA